MDEFEDSGSGTNSGGHAGDVGGAAPVGVADAAAPPLEDAAARLGLALVSVLWTVLLGVEAADPSGAGHGPNICGTSEVPETDRGLLGPDTLGGVDGAKADPPELSGG